jgi:hypothetical protein
VVVGLLLPKEVLEVPRKEMVALLLVVVVVGLLYLMEVVVALLKVVGEEFPK